MGIQPKIKGHCLALTRLLAFGLAGGMRREDVHVDRIAIEKDQVIAHYRRPAE
ncbi:hypothetical protein D3C84_1208520 [compost metagenome]